MKTKSFSPVGVSIINIVFILITLLFCLALFIFIGTGGTLLSYYSGDSLVTGTLAEKKLGQVAQEGFIKSSLQETMVAKNIFTGYIINVLVNQ